LGFRVAIPGTAEVKGVLREVAGIVKDANNIVDAVKTAGDKGAILNMKAE
jgi:hypothetical protein